MLGLLALNLLRREETDGIAAKVFGSVFPAGIAREENPGNSNDNTPERKGYKIIVYPIESGIVKDYSCPLGTFDVGTSKLAFGFRVGVKECSPRPDFNEQKDVGTFPAVSPVVDSYKKKYGVPDHELYFCLRR